MSLRDIAHYIEQETLLYVRMNTAKALLMNENNRPYEGLGIGIAILDTGVSAVDDFLLPKNRIVAFRDFVNGKDSPYDDNGHGTHVTCLLIILKLGFKGALLPHFPSRTSPSSFSRKAAFCSFLQAYMLKSALDCVSKSVLSTLLEKVAKP